MLKVVNRKAGCYLIPSPLGMLSKKLIMQNSNKDYLTAGAELNKSTNLNNRYHIFEISLGQ